jgi:hypothetical protein
MPDSGQKAVIIKPITALSVALVVFIAAVDILYLIPRYGGIMARLLEGSAAGSFVGQTEGNRDKLAFALSIYHNDSDKKSYPAALDELWGSRGYMTEPMPRADVFIDAGGGKFERAHWRRASDKVKIFKSRAEADDSGGWGYVGDPSSPEWGTVFVNCTHEHFKRKVPWNMAFEPAPQPQPEQTAADAAQQDATN